MNVLIVAGRITGDAVVRHTADGKAVSGFSVATDVGYGDNKHALFVRCSDWRKPAENLAPYLKKGTPVTVTGECDLRSYEKDGQTRTNLELNVRDIALQGSKQASSEPQGDAGFRQPPVQQGTAEQQRAAEGMGATGFADDDIPF